LEKKIPPKFGKFRNSLVEILEKEILSQFG
jgi:hypothetical protein